MKLSPIPPKKLEKLLFSEGFQRVRQKGSHAAYKHPDGRFTTITFHGGCEIGPVLLSKILREIGMDREEFNRKR
jgi:predicted RNA binding protein YcfA (HicA-like mRNA interferase family)